MSTRSVTEEAHKVWQEVTMEVEELSTIEVVEATDSDLRSENMSQIWQIYLCKNIGRLG